MLISVHLPKTAGSSFLRSLEDYFGDSLAKDYADYPINAPPYERNLAALKACIDNAQCDFHGIRCIHGHFLPLKYLLLSTTRKTRFVTWIRDPVDRLISHFYFWQQYYDHDHAKPLRRKVIEEHWSLERFCLGPELRNFYFQYLWGFPLECFDFIGITENYEADMAYFSSSVLGTTLNIYYENIGSTSKKLDISIDREFRLEIEAHHAIDVQLYKRALELSNKRRNGITAE